MFEVVPFELGHIKPLLSEPINSHLRKWAAGDYGYTKHLAEKSLALSVVVDGTVVMCAFLVEIWKGRAYAVIVLSEKLKQKSISAYRGLKNFMIKLPFNRVEFDSPCGFDLGHRRAKFIGFKVMCERAKSYLPNGEDATVYEWVK